MDGFRPINQVLLGRLYQYVSMNFSRVKKHPYALVESYTLSTTKKTTNRRFTLKNIKTKQQLLNLIRSTPITDIITTDKKHLITKFTKENQNYILIKTGTGVIK